MMNKSVDSGDFEPGIYNYCDYWCERCPDTAKCRLFADKEAEKNRPKSDNRENNRSTMTGEQGIIINAVGEFEIGNCEPSEDEWKLFTEKAESERSELDAKACLKYARTYQDETREFLQDYRAEREQYASELGLAVDEADIGDELAVIEWYHTLLAVKTGRLLFERSRMEQEKDSELNQLMARDLLRSTALVNKCFQRSFSAISSLLKKRPAWFERMLAALLARLALAEIEFRQELGLPKRNSESGPDYGERHSSLMDEFDDDNAKGLTSAIQFLADQPRDSLAYGLIGEMLLRLGDYRAALPLCETAARLHPHEAADRFLFGTALMQTGRFNRARAEFECAAELDREDRQIKRNLGIATAMLGRFKEDGELLARGRGLLAEIVNADSQAVEAMVDLAQSHLMAHELDKAFEWIAKARQIDPQNDFVNMIYADIENARNRLVSSRESREFFEKEKAVKAYSGPKPKDDEDMDEHLARQFEIEKMIVEFNDGQATPERIARILKKLEKTGLIGQITAIKDGDSSAARVASEYISFHQQVEALEKKLAPDEIASLGQELSFENVDGSRTKTILLRLAHQSSPAALAILERYLAGAQEEWAIWAKMAVDECRAFNQTGATGPGMFFSEI